jgi:phage replication-related protein YjqB (UPF0714/DUF867 family)
MTAAPDASKYSGFADLAKAQVEGRDFRVVVEPRVGSNVAVVAPHGGKIEAFTSDVARSIAGADFNLYLFEGTRVDANYLALHLTSHRFDEPRCLALLSECRYVITVHGCGDQETAVLLGGRDEDLRTATHQALDAAGIEVRSEGHQFPAADSQNICNRGKSGMGVQIEIPRHLRSAPAFRAALAGAVRSVLLQGPIVGHLPSRQTL